ncbi:unnamed protein product [Sphagnum tenellum]
MLRLILECSDTGRETETWRGLRLILLRPECQGIADEYFLQSYKDLSANVTVRESAHDVLRPAGPRQPHRSRDQPARPRAADHRHRHPELQRRSGSDRANSLSLIPKWPEVLGMSVGTAMILAALLACVIFVCRRRLIKSLGYQEVPNEDVYAVLPRRAEPAVIYQHQEPTYAIIDRPRRQQEAKPYPEVPQPGSSRNSFAQANDYVSMASMARPLSRSSEMLPQPPPPAFARYEHLARCPSCWSSSCTGCASATPPTTSVLSAKLSPPSLRACRRTYGCPTAAARVLQEWTSRRRRRNRKCCQSSSNWCNKLNRYELKPLVLDTPPRKVSFAAPLQSFLPSPDKTDN